MDFSLNDLLTLNILILISGFTGTFVFFLIVCIINVSIGYVIFDIYLYIGIGTTLILMIMNLIAGSPTDNSVYLSAFVPLLIYLIISKTRKSKVIS